MAATEIPSGPGGISGDVLMLQRLLGNRATCARLARGGLADPHPASVQRYFKFESPATGAVDLSPHTAAIRAELKKLDPGKFKEGSKALNQFDKIAAGSQPRNFDTWAEGEGIDDWREILRNAAELDVDAAEFQEEMMFGTQRADKKYEGGRMEGLPLSGFVPVKPKTGERMLTTSERGDYRYDADDDQRVLQLLRQVSTQLYLYLEGRKKLGKTEQEIQTMWAYGNLLVGSNNLDTMTNLYDDLTTLKGLAHTDEVLYNVLTGKYGKGALGIVSKRHGDKLATFYEGLRQERVSSPEVQSIIDRLIDAELIKISDLGQASQIEDFADNPGRICILTAESLIGVAHAEQRLIELRDIAQLYKADGKAWVAGKKRPCFGCWVHERLTNTNATYQLVYQNQPGKGFMNTYRDAPQEEKDEWHDVLDADDDFSVYESKRLGGKAGPESDSEAEDQLPVFDDENELVDMVAEPTAKPKHVKALKRLWSETGADVANLESVSRARKKPKASPPEKDEDQMEADLALFRTAVSTHRNPAVRRRYPLKKRYKRRTPKKTS